MTNDIDQPSSAQARGWLEALPGDEGNPFLTPQVACTVELLEADKGLSKKFPPVFH